MELENTAMYEEIDNNEAMPVDVETEESGMGTGLAMLLGAGMMAAGVAAVGLAKKGIKWLKSKKEAKKTDEDETKPAEVIDAEVAEKTDE